MENKYRDLLRKAKENNAAESAFFPSDWSYLAPEQAEVTVSPPVDPVGDQYQDVTEKTKVLDSLNVFGEQKLEGKDEFNFLGGKILPKPIEPEVSSQLNASNLKLPEIESNFKELAGEKLFQQRFTDAVPKNSSGIKVLFVTDDVVSVNDVEALDTGDELGVYFDSEVNHLFGRMIKAMNVQDQEFFVSSIQINQQENLSNCLSEILYFKPELVISLGALATNSLLASKKRLKDTHGQVSTVEININNEDKIIQFSLMPLFSPKLLQTAPNMKKTAWTDMQKAMEFLNL